MHKKTVLLIICEENKVIIILLSGYVLEYMYSNQHNKIYHVQQNDRNQEVGKYF